MIATAGRVTPDQRDAVCRFLTAEFPAEKRSAAAQWLLNCFETQFDPAWLFAATDKRNQVQAATYLHLDGHGGAMVLGYRATDADAEIRLWQALDRGLSEHNVRMIQANTAPEKKANYRGLAANGFLPPIHLVEQRRDFTPDAPAPKAVFDPRFKLEAYEAELFDSFTAALAATYVDSLDTPELNHARDPADVMRSHLDHARGMSPFLFRLLNHDQPIGVLFLNPADKGQPWELSYFGLAPDWRGKGLGRPIVESALAMAALADAPGMTLTYDSRNEAARKIYNRCGFQSCRSYDVYLKLIKS